MDLKRIAASALSDISKHSPEVCIVISMELCKLTLLRTVLQLAQTVVDAGAIAHLTKHISSSDHKLKVLFTYSPPSLVLFSSLSAETSAECSESDLQALPGAGRDGGGGRYLPSCTGGAQRQDSPLSLS